jgi:predicted GIY-YIG superfamily endonuclease
MRQKSKSLFSQYLENVSRKLLEEHGEIIRKYVRNRHGVYALYNKNELYYVGLASNLRTRLKHHLKDRHANTWDNFSIYLTIGDQHLRELEALLHRIAMPNGNRQKGKFRYAQDLTRTFRDDLKAYHTRELNEYFGGQLPCKPVKKSPAKEESAAMLAPYVTKRFHIRLEHHGKRYIAHVRRDGTIMFAGDSAECDRLKGKVYFSPSLAAKAAVKCNINGWRAWTYERAPGDWVRLDELRRK